MKRETDPFPLLSAVHALGHIGNPLAIPLVIEHRLHPHADVRFAVACALGNFADDPRTVGTLLALMRDDDKDVRDWWTFGLGVQGDLDSVEIRDAVWQRMMSGVVCLFGLTDVKVPCRWIDARQIQVQSRSPAHAQIALRFRRSRYERQFAPSG